MIIQIPSTEILEYIKKNPKSVLIDVRTEEEWINDGVPDGDKIGLKTHFLTIQFADGNFNNNFIENFKKLNIKFDSNKIFVHRITCNGKKGSDRRLMYPFVTQDNSNKGYYLFEGAIYHLEYDYIKD